MAAEERLDAVRRPATRGGIAGPAPRPCTEGARRFACSREGGRRPMGGFEAVEAKVSFPELERRILRFWREADVFHESLRRRQGSPEWIFYEGPPTENGRL